MQAAACICRIACGPRVGQKLKMRRHDGTTHLVMAPLEFMQRLAVLVPKAKSRALVVPHGPDELNPAAPRRTV